MSLSSLIVQREVASIRQVEEALARQVLYGGDLVTNLLEVVQLPEAILMPLLAESVGIPAAPVGMLPAPTAQARALVPEDVAAHRLIVPLSIEGDRLILAVADPLGRDVLDELSFALSVHIEERIAPSVRIREALARVYGVPLDRRMARLVGRLAGVDPSVPNSLPPLRGPRASAPPLPGALSHDLPKLNPPGMPAMGTMRFPEAAAEDRRNDVSRPPPPPAPPPRGADPTAVLPSLVREARAMTKTEAIRRRGPVTLERVTEELAEIKDREALLQLFFDFARQFFEYSALFIVHGDIAEGRDAFGNGAPRDRVLALGVPLDIPSVLGTVRTRGAPLCTVPNNGGLDGVLMGDLRRDVRSQVLVIPIVVRSRVVSLLIADDGAAGIDPSAQGEVITVAALVGREFERLIVRMKLQGFTGEAPASERRVDPRRVQAKPRRRDAEAREAAVQALGDALAVPLGSSHTGLSPVPDPLPPSSRSEQPSERPGALRVGALLAPVGDAAPVAVVPPAPLPDPRPLTPAPIFTIDPTAPAQVDLPPPAPTPLARISPVPRSFGTLPGFPSPIVEVVAPRRRDSAPDSLPEESGWEAASDDATEPPTEKLPHAWPEARPVEATPPIVERGRLFTGEYSDRPPPPQTVAVRHPSGRPIPREEEEGDEGPASSTRFVEHIPSRPPEADLRQARLLREIDALTASFVNALPDDESQPVSLRTGLARNIPPHRPPSSRTHEPLPSVIVDVTGQIDQLVLAFIANPKDEQVESELLHLGQEAMPSIMKQFPGPLMITRDTLDDSWPRVSECGPVLRLIAAQRRVALPFVLARMDDSATESRFWATYLLTELPYPEAIPAVVARIFDDSKRVRRAARLVAHVLGETSAKALVTHLDRIVRDPNVTSPRRVVTIDALGEMRDPLVMPVLLGALGDEDEDVALAARRSMMRVSLQDFGRDTRKWLVWWNAAASRHRIEWLIDALTQEIPALRRAAGQELKALTEEYFGYYDDLPKKDRERAQQLYRDWWRTKGQARFRKA
jgi:hypothetical protein